MKIKVSNVNTPNWKEVTVKSRIPAELEKLSEISRNIWWAWNFEATELFRDLDPELWKECGQNPVLLLERMSYEKLEALAKDKVILRRMNDVYTKFRDYMDVKPDENRPSVAYFSMEYGLSSVLKIYSGGLGVLAGDYLKEAFGRSELKLIRCMPNTPALVLEGCTGVCAEENVTEEDMEQVLALLRSFGIASVVPERLMDVVVGVSGSSPAYVFMFIEAMADEAVAAGMPRKQAYEFAAQSVLGSARMVLETGRHPGELKDMVCSPGGTTIQAVKVLEEKGMRAAVMDAMDACIEKSQSM